MRTPFLRAAFRVRRTLAFSRRVFSTPGLLLALWLLGGRVASAEPVTALAFSTDSRQLLSGGYGRVTIRPTQGNGMPRSLALPLSQVHALAFPPNGKMLAVGGGTPGASGAVCLVRWPEGKVVAILNDHSDLVNALAFSPNGTLLATASADKTVVLRRFPTDGKEKPLRVFTGHTGAVLAAAFSPDGNLLVTGGTDRSIRVWEVGSGKLLRTLDNHTDTIHALAFRPPAKDTPANAPFQCASGSEDRTARVWQPEIGRMVRIVRGAEGALLAVAYAPDGHLLFTAGTEGIIRAVDGDSDAIVKTWPAGHDWIYCLAVSPDGKTLACGDASGQVVTQPIEP
jgi:WD40 repeat protein